MINLNILWETTDICAMIHWHMKMRNLTEIFWFMGFGDFSTIFYIGAGSMAFDLDKNIVIYFSGKTITKSAIKAGPHCEWSIPFQHGTH